MNQIRRGRQLKVQKSPCIEGRHSRPALGEIRLAIRLRRECCAITSPTFLSFSRKGKQALAQGDEGIYLRYRQDGEPEGKTHCNSDEA
jgi:hypothetical protein